MKYEVTFQILKKVWKGTTVDIEIDKVPLDPDELRDHIYDIGIEKANKEDVWEILDHETDSVDFYFDEIEE